MIEKMIQELTEAIKAQTAEQRRTNEIWSELNAAAARCKAGLESGDSVAAGGVTIIPGAESKQEKKQEAKATKAEAAPTPSAEAKAAKAEAATESPSEAEETIALEDVQAAMKTKLADHRPAVVKVLASFGVAKASELKPEQFKAARAAFNAIGASDDLS